MTADLSTPAKRLKYWSDAAKDALVGRTIVKAWYPTRAEIKANDLEDTAYDGALWVELDNGDIWAPSQDDEGNGPGALFALGNSKGFVNPVLEKSGGVFPVMG